MFRLSRGLDAQLRAGECRSRAARASASGQPFAWPHPAGTLAVVPGQRSVTVDLGSSHR
jgi:hypothetical protein